MEDAMRDIRSDLQERADTVRRRIEAENARFANLLSQLKAEHQARVGDLHAQLQAVNKLISFTAWRQDVRTALLVAIAGAATAELSVRNSLGAGVEPASPIG
jgi:hypothetical protein